MINRESPTALITLASRLRSDPRYMSYVLAAYQRQENLTDEDLAQELGTLPMLIVRLALCRRPASSSPQFAEQVREIADYTLTDEAQLANILRQVDGLEKLAERPIALEAPEVEAQSRHPLTGLLTAARDRDESMDDEATPPDVEAKPEE